MKTAITALATALAFALLTLTGCQKEHSATTPADTYTIHYEVDGVSHTADLSDDMNLTAFMLSMTQLASEGCIVTVFPRGDSTAWASKTIVTFQTSNRDEASAWAAEMHNQGYTVTIVHDSDTGTYTCIAYSTGHALNSLVGTKWARYWVNDFGGRYGDYKWYNYDTLYFVNNEEYILFAHLTDQEEENPYEQSYVRSAGYYFDGMSEGYIYSGPDYQLKAHFKYRPDKIIFNTSSDPATRPTYYRVLE